MKPIPTLLLLLSFHEIVTSFIFQNQTSFTSKSILNSSSLPYFASSVDIKEHENSEKTVVVAGSTGYIGRAVVRESIKRGYNTIALVRNPAKISPDTIKNYFPGAQIVQCDVEDTRELKNLFKEKNYNVDTVISCLASASGLRKEAYAIDYQATLNCMNACMNDWDGRQFILLSAFCVRNPLLQLQQAKLKVCLFIIFLSIQS